MSARRWRLPAFVVTTLAGALWLLRPLDHAPSPVVPASDRSAFSAERAMGHLRDLIGENVAHPPGSAAQREIARRIVGKLEALGYEPERQEGLQCSTLAPGCTRVKNLIAVRRGTQPGPAMMITAHYDSVPGSAAAADDGAGVAAMLEIADLISQREPLQHDVIFLFADGEESGLRGAMLFAEHHPLMQRVAFVVNLEARGASGPSVMFETGPGNEALIGLFGQAVPRPVTNSLLYEVYRRMPNDTDFTIHRRAGAQGFNFAFTRSASLYHSARDDLAQLDPRSLQHQGENALAVLLAAGSRPLDSLRSDRDASYVDVGARALLAWPAGWNVPLALAGLLLAGALMLWRWRPEWRGFGWALLAILLVFAGLPLAGWLLSWPLGRWNEAHPLDHPHPWPGRVALIAASVLVVFAVARAVGRRAGARAMLMACWLLFGAMALLTAFLVAGAAFIFIAPSIAFVALALIEAMRAPAARTPLPRLAAGAGFVVASWFALYLFLLVEVVFGFSLSHLKMLPLLLLGLSLLPLATAHAERGSSRAVLVSLSVVVLASAAWGAAVPSHTFDRPRGVNLVHVQEEGKPAAWILESFGEPGRELVGAMGFEPRKEPFLRYGVVPREAYRAPAPSIAAPAPLFSIQQDVVEAGRRIVGATLQSQREAPVMMLALAAGSPVESVRIEGQAVIEGASAEARVIGLHGLAEAPVRIEITARTGEPLELIALDIVPLESEGEAARRLANRPDHAAPLHNGDQSVALRRLKP